MVAIELHELTFVVTDCDTHTVSVRVGRDHYVRTLLVGNVHRHLHRRRLLRVRGSHGREISVAHILLRNVIDILEAQTVERLRHKPYAAAVERSIYELDVTMPCHRLRAKCK